VSVQRTSDRQRQFLYVDQELTMATSAIESGLAILQHNHLYRRNEFPFMLLLSNGIERLLKIVQHLAVFNAEGRYRAVGKTHRLDDLCAWVLTNCFTADYLTLPDMQADREYLASDPMLSATLAVLSSFADVKGDRYIYMDAIVNPNIPGAADRWPSRQWARLEQAFIDLAGGVVVERVEQQHHAATRELVGVIEHFMRVIGRLFAFGGLGETGRQLSGYVSRFTRMTEGDYGKAEYRA
jgi:hypothetical protein